MLKFLLPLIAALKVKHCGQDGWQLGREVAQAYKGCCADLSRPVEPQESLAD